MTFLAKPNCFTLIYNVTLSKHVLKSVTLSSDIVCSYTSSRAIMHGYKRNNTPCRAAKKVHQTRACINNLPIINAQAPAYSHAADVHTPTSTLLHADMAHLSFKQTPYINQTLAPNLAHLSPMHRNKRDGFGCPHICGAVAASTKCITFRCIELPQLGVQLVCLLA